MLKHKIQELLTPYKHVYCTCSCKTMTIWCTHCIHVQPCWPKENIGDYLSPGTPPLYFIFSFFVFWVICPLSLAIKNVFPFKIINKKICILPNFLPLWAYIIHQLQTDIHKQKYMYIHESKEWKSPIQNCFLNYFTFNTIMVPWI